MVAFDWQSIPQVTTGKIYGLVDERLYSVIIRQLTTSYRHTHKALFTSMRPARRCPSRPLDHRAVYTAACPVRSTVDDRSSTVCRVVARCCQHQTARCRCLYRTRLPSVCRGEIFYVHSLGHFQRKQPTFLEKPVSRKAALPMNPFPYSTGV